jgi:PAS domain S-box-containing protein
MLRRPLPDVETPGQTRSRVHLTPRHTRHSLAKMPVDAPIERQPLGLDRGLPALEAAHDTPAKAIGRTNTAVSSGDRAVAHSGRTDIAEHAGRAETALDIEDQRRLEAALGPLFVHTREAVVGLDVTSSQIVLWNSAAQALFGYTTAEAVGRPLAMLLPPAVDRVHSERLAHYARSGDAAILTEGDPLEMPATSSTGEEIRVTLSFAPLDVSDHPARFVLLMFRQASGIKSAGLQALQLARAEARVADLQAKLGQRDALLLDSTRDLAAALGQTRRSAALLTRVAYREASVHRRIKVLARVVDRRTQVAQRYVDQLADAAAIHATDFELCFERVNLVPLVGRSVAATKARSAAHRIQLGAPQGLTALGDARCLAQVLDDLIQRAVRRNPRGCWIDVDLRRPLAGTARIEIRDYGCRPSAGETDVLLDLSRADRAWNLNRYIVEQHGGTMSVEFPEESGVRVVVVLPTSRGRVRAEA